MARSTNSDAAETRARVLEFVRRNPGVHGREVERGLGLAAGTGAYHLSELERQALVDRYEEDGYTRFSSAGSWSRKAQAAMAVLRRPVALLVAKLVRDTPDIKHGQIAQELGLAKASVTYYLEALEGAGIIRSTKSGRTKTYRIDEASLAGLEAQQVEPFDPFTRIWNDLTGRPKP